MKIRKVNIYDALSGNPLIQGSFVSDLNLLVEKHSLVCYRLEFKWFKLHKLGNELTVLSHTE